MSKSSKSSRPVRSIKYNDHMNVVDKISNTKSLFESNQAKSHNMHKSAPDQHPKHKFAYPEVLAEINAQIQNKCICRKNCKCKE